MKQTAGIVVQVSEELFNRLNAYLESPVAIVRTKKELVGMAVEEFLDREEPLAEKLLSVRNSLRQNAITKT